MGKFFSFGNSNEEEDREQDGEENDTNNTSRRQASHSRDDEADERTSLLQQPPQYGGRPLNPDDPAVTPMSLWSVQVIRFFTLVFFIITMVWWLVLLITQFVSVPGLHSRGGGWYDFSYTTLAAGILALLLLSFTVPSSAEQITMGVVSLLLMIDMIIILSVPKLRDEEGWSGIASVIWVLVMSLWSILSDRVVQSGKASEEERLTGRVETRRSLKQWCSVFSTTFVMIVFLIITVLFTATISLRAYDATLHAPGGMYSVDDNKYFVHLYCTPYHGNNDTKESVTVLIEGGEESVARGLGDWAHDNYMNGTIGRYCYWDRPGMGWSEVAPSPMSAGMASDALSEALVTAGEDGPYILVSAGVGSIYSRIFASRHGNSIKGILMIDPLNEAYLPNLSASGRGFLLWARGVISPLGIQSLWGWVFKGRTREDRIWGRSSYTNGRLIKSKFQESLSANSFTKAEITTARAILPRNIPLVVVSSGRSVKRSQDWDEKQKDLTKITDDLISWDIVNKAFHNVWEDAEGYEILSKRIKNLIKLAIAI